MLNEDVHFTIVDLEDIGAPSSIAEENKKWVSDMLALCFARTVCQTFFDQDPDMVMDTYDYQKFRDFYLMINKVDDKTDTEYTKKSALIEKELNPLWAKQKDYLKRCKHFLTLESSRSSKKSSIAKEYLKVFTTLWPKTK